MIHYVFDKVENIVGKGEKACTSDFSFSHGVFKRLLPQTRQEVCGNGLTRHVARSPLLQGSYNKRVLG